VRRLPLSQQKEFQAIQNAVIQEAERIRLGTISFEDEPAQMLDEPENIYRIAEYYRRMRDAIYDQAVPWTSATMPWSRCGSWRSMATPTISIRWVSSTGTA
jgi:hypothetical protein